MSYCSEWCKEACTAKNDEDCVKNNRPPVHPGNEVVWYLFQLFATSWDRSSFSGQKTGYNYLPMMDMLRTLQAEPAVHLDTIERMRVLESAALELEAERAQTLKSQKG